MPLIELLALAAGAVAGCLGALIGIGGGVLLVPVLNTIVGLSFSQATAASLVGVLATSSSAGVAPTGRRLHNARLAILLLLFSVSGAVIGGHTVAAVSESTLKLVFGGTAALIASVMFVRLKARNLLSIDADVGLLGGHFHDADTGTDVAYRVKRVPLAATVSFGAGVLTSWIGIGGGILIVPMLNGLCGVPLRVSAATSVLMIGVTAVPSLAGRWASGDLGDFHMAAITAVGVLLGFQVGRAISPLAPVRWLKTVIAALVALVAVQYLFRR